MAKKQSPEAANPRAQNETPDISSGIFQDLQAAGGVSLSESDSKFLASVASHLANAAIHNDLSRIVTCSELLSSFCAKFPGQQDRLSGGYFYE